MVFRLENALISAQAEAEDKKLRKELALEVLALKVPFRNRYSLWNQLPNQVPWPGRLSAAFLAKPALLNL
jgi:hypothetical protein